MARTALVTGASSGIGREIARELDKRGFRVILAARREDRLRELAEELSDSRVIACDLSRREECERLYEETKAERLTVLVNNAGFGKLGRFEEIPLDDELAMIDTNVKALHILTKLFLQDFIREDRGYILNVASSAGLMPGGPLMATYYATKAYVTSLTGAIYEELKQADSSVSISALCPGPVDTEFNSVANAQFGVKSISAEYCAKRAVEGLFARQLIITPERGMGLAAKAAQLAPRRISLAITGQLQSGKQKDKE
ncbi:SDR family oxidoreductase [Ruminococcus sp.]|uniref:SDR family NAD(P)-dependent oxidoreductase n=1 Tax=Ruminococcus sp. TaxID=41978 RepID=UPI0025F5B44B|nr:SDR family oxidoreductase [Ruminococcus sp.]MBQ8968085.1 SDR family oxidoreductase [Ruminococcus sp.]